MLNEGARASTAALEGASLQAGAEPAGSRRRRFAPDDASVSFAVARGALPTQGLPLAAVITAGLAATTGVLAAHQFRGGLAPSVVGPLDLSSTASLGGWLGSSLMLIAGAMCAVIYGLRSNRTDDVRGLYRWWLTAGAACVACSAAHASELPTLLTSELSRATGFSPLGGALCWMAPLAVVAGVLAFRPLADLRESRLSLALTVGSAASFGLACFAMIGLLPAQLAAHAVLVASGGLLLGLTFLLGAQLAYVRRVLLETDGVIAAPKRKVKPIELKVTPAAESSGSGKATPWPTVGLTPAKSESDNATEPPTRRAERQAAAEVKLNQATVTETQWTDGSDGPCDDEEDSPRRKLTKAERKRLRKTKAGRFAA